MKYIHDGGTWIVAIFGSIYTLITGHLGVATFLLLVIMLLDIASGVLKGWKSNNLRSAISSLGIAKKGGILLTILFAFTLDLAINNGQPIFVPMFVWVSIGNESLSFVENIQALGVQVPEAMTKRLGQVQDEYSRITQEKDKQI